MSGVTVREVGPRGCGYPVEGGCYIESIGGAGGMLPWFVPIQPPVPWHFFRGVTIVDGAYILASGHAPGTSSVERDRLRLGQTESKDTDYERLKLMEEFAQIFFGEHAKIVKGHTEQFARELNLALDENGHPENGGDEKTFEKAILGARESKNALRRLAPHVRV